MSLFARAAGPESRGFTARDVWGDAWDTSVAGVPVSHENALKVSAMWACSTLIADLIASSPIDILRQVGNEKQPAPKPAWVVRPNLYQDPYSFWFSAAMSLGLDGNAFIPTTRNSSGTVVEMLPPLAPTEVQIDSDKAGRVVYVRGSDTYNADQIKHIPLYVRPGSLRGMSPVTYGATSIGLARVADEFATNFFANGAHLGTVLEVDGDLDDTKARQLADRFKIRHGGLRKAFLPLVLTGGVKASKIGATPDEAQMIETRKHQLGEVCRLYRVPPHLVGGETMTTWGTGIEQMNLGLVIYTLRPWVTRLEHALFDLLPAPRFVKFNLGALLRGDVKTRSAYYQTMRLIDGMSVNEIRGLEDLPPIDGGDDFGRPFNSAHNGDTAAKEPADGNSGDTGN